MKNKMLAIGLVVVLIALAYHFYPRHTSAFVRGKCIGDDDCDVCKSCRSCNFCKSGTCGVCNGKKTPRQYREGYCERVIDGDTIVVVQSGKDVEVRLIGVDTPETKDPRKPIQRFGREASKFTTDMVLGKPVRLTFDQHKIDHFGRALAYVHVNGVLVNKKIIEQGFGHVYAKYPFDRKMMEEFRVAEREAREQKRGLWK